MADKYPIINPNYCLNSSIKGSAVLTSVYASLSGLTLKINVDGYGNSTMTFGATADGTSFLSQINSFFPTLTASLNSSVKLKLESNSYINPSIVIGNGTANSVIGFSNGSSAGQLKWGSALFDDGTIMYSGADCIKQTYSSTMYDDGNGNPIVSKAKKTFFGNQRSSDELPTSGVITYLNSQVATPGNLSLIASQPVYHCAFIK